MHNCHCKALENSDLSSCDRRESKIYKFQGYICVCANELKSILDVKQTGGDIILAQIDRLIQHMYGLIVEMAFHRLLVFLRLL